MRTTEKFETFLEELEDMDLQEDTMEDIEHMQGMIDDWGLERVLVALEFALKGIEGEAAGDAANALTKLKKEKPKTLRQKILDLLGNL
jgi:hypothetical protein